MTCKVALFSMPWGNPVHSPIGISIVNNALRSASITAESYFVNVDFSRYLLERGLIKTNELLYTSGKVSEIVSAHLLKKSLDFSYEGNADQDAYLLKNGVDEATFNHLTEIFKDFTETYINSIDLSTVKVIAFSLNIWQTTSSLYWAHRISLKYPNIKIVFGGSQCEDPMGLELIRAFDFIHVVARGEVDSQIAQIFESLISEDVDRLKQVSNICYREGVRIHTTGKNIISAKEFIAPNYEGYIESFEKYALVSKKIPILYYEASRGCWWGAKHQCTFCGINTSAIVYRDKDSYLVVDEIKEFITRYKTFNIAFSDTILSLEQLKKSIPKLKLLNEKVNNKIKYFIDIKSNISKDDLMELKRSGCYAIQPGIESFSDGHLKVMDKGSRALHQIQLLRWCKELNIHPYYSILTHIPGESAEHYKEMEYYIKRLYHLVPPSGAYKISIDRYSPIFNDYQKFGYEKIEPEVHYQYFFPEGTVDISRFAYHFYGENSSLEETLLKIERNRVSNIANEVWPRESERNQFYYQDSKNGSVNVYRSIGNKLEKYELNEIESKIVLYCERFRNLNRIFKHFPYCDEKTIRINIDRLVNKGVLLQSWDKGYYLTIPVYSVKSNGG